MNIAPARSPLVVSLSCLFLAFGLLVVGCDSGGSGSGTSGGNGSGNGDSDGGTSLDNTSSVTVDLKSSSSGSSSNASGEKAGAKASGTLTVGFYYANDSGGDCNLSTTKTVDDSDLPYNESFDPANFSGSLSSGCGSAADFDGVQVDFAPESGFPTEDLVLSLLDEDGTEITSDDDPSDGFGVSETVSDDVDLPDDIGEGDDGGGDDGGGDDSGDDDGGGDDGGGDGGDTSAPSAPLGLTGSAGTGTVDLNWDAVSADDLAGYNVYRSTSSISDVSDSDLSRSSPLNGSLLSGTSYTDDGASNGTTYYYVVTAVDESGNESGISNVISLTTSASSDAIAFTSEDEVNNNFDIYRVGFPGRLTRDPSLEKSPSWKPDGTRIAFTREDEIYTINPSGFDLEGLYVDGNVSVSSISWGKDPNGGSQIVFSSANETNFFGKIYKIKPGESTPTPLTQGVEGEADIEPNLSPDGEKVAFVREFEIYTVNVDGSNVKSLGVRGSGPVWSPDGSKIAFSRSDGEASQIFIVNADGSGTPSKVTDNSYNDHVSDWKGSRLAFSSRRTGSDNIYTIGTDGNGLNQKTFTAREDSDAVWNPSN